MGKRLRLVKHEHYIKLVVLVKRNTSAAGGEELGQL